MFAQTGHPGPRRTVRRGLRIPLLALAAAVAIAGLWWWRPQAPFPDFSAIADLESRKRAFVAYLCPIVDRVNGEIASDQEQVSQLAARFAERSELRPRERRALEEHARLYGLSVDVEPALLLERLERRVGELPNELIIALAALESGWGTSELAVAANNLFGRRCFYDEDCVTLNQGREAELRYRRFDDPADSVRLYVRDMNTLMPYVGLRNLRHANPDADGIVLASGLHAYSTRGPRYVAQVQRMIRQNALKGVCDPPKGAA